MAGALAARSADESPRRETILAEAGALFARKGVAATTVRDIAEATGLLAGSLYHYFDSKDAMVDAILSPSIEDLLSAYRTVEGDHASGPMEKLVALIRASFASIANHPAAAVIYLKDREHLIRSPRFAYLESTRAEVDAIWLAVLRDGVTEGSFRDDVDAEVFYRFAVSALWSTAGWHAVQGQPLPALADQHIAIFMDALRRPEKR